MAKTLDAMTLEDFDEVPVWELRTGGIAAPRAELKEIPDGAANLIVRVHGKLADATPVTGIANVACPPPRLRIERLYVDGAWHSLDFTSSENGPESLARRLKRTPAQVFPMWVRAEIKADCTGDNLSEEIDITDM